jgi:arylsulfatase A-like enzyme
MEQNLRKFVLQRGTFFKLQLKTTQWEGGVRTPAVIWSPILESRVSNQLIHITDWMPTLLSAAGGSLQGILLDGTDQWSALVEKDAFPRREALLQYDEVKHVYGLRRDNWKITNGTLQFITSHHISLKAQLLTSP